MFRLHHRLLLIMIAIASPVFAQDAYKPGQRSLLDAHNCYPYHGEYADRIDRALSTGLPVAIEQDLVWYTDPATEKSWSIVAHNKPFDGTEPTIRDYFFERIRPLIEEALKSGDKTDWPLIVLNLDFKDSHREHISAIWELLGEYESWLTTAPRTDTPEQAAPLTVGPVLVLTGSSSAQEKIFYDAVPVGEKLRVFGAADSRSVLRPGLTAKEKMMLQVSAPPSEMLAEPITNYRRWWNNSWHIVEAGGAPMSRDWTPEDDARLKALTAHAHDLGYWIRFYTINGHNGRGEGWGLGYNTRSLEAAQERWQAEIDAGVDFIATDMYEDFSALKSKQAR